MGKTTERTARAIRVGQTAQTACARTGLCLLAIALLIPVGASAQSAADRVNQMTAEAMEAYNSLEIDRAGPMLVEAIEFAHQNGVGGPPLARANMNLGIVYIGGVSDTENGLVYLLAAVCADPSIQLDPLTSTPDIQAVFQQAQQRAQSGGCATGPGPQPGPQELGPAQPAYNQPAPVPADLIHTAPTEQRSQTPLPLYVEAPIPDLDKVQLYYKGLGMDAFKRVDMVPYGAGYAYQLSCQDIWDPRIVYYIVVLGDNGRVLASIGSAQAPVEVAVTGASPSNQPSLPDAAPPASCAEEECPPGQVCPPKRGIAAIGEPCEGTNDCQSGLNCGDSVCVLAGAGAADPGDDDSEPASTDFAPVFLQFGYAMGFASVQAGMLTDGGPPAGTPILDVFQGRSPWVADANSTGPDGMPAGSECPAFGKATNAAVGENPDSYCANISKAGFVSNTAIRGAIGYFVAPWLSLAAILRYQPDHGEGTVLPGMLVGGRMEIMLTSPGATGLSMSLFAGGTMGTIHAKPPPKDAQWEPIAPYVISGLGGAHAGSNLRYRFARNVGVFLAPEVDVQLPLFMLNIDVTAGLELAL